MVALKDFGTIQDLGIWHLLAGIVEMKYYYNLHLHALLNGCKL